MKLSRITQSISFGRVKKVVYSRPKRFESLCINIKQWPLDSKFIEFEYSPEIRHFWQIRVLAKMTLFENGSDSLNSSTFANLVCSDSPDLPTFAKPFCKDSPDSRKASFA
jgi:hypothetical protein